MAKWMGLDLLFKAKNSTSVKEYKDLKIVLSTN